MESGMLFQKEKWKMSQPTWKRWKRDRQTDRHPDEVFTFLWCVNVRLHSINHPLREAGRLHARCAEGKVAQAQLSDTVFYIHYQKFVSIFFFFTDIVECITMSTSWEKLFLQIKKCIISCCSLLIIFLVICTVKEMEYSRVCSDRDRFDWTCFI